MVPRQQRVRAGAGARYGAGWIGVGTLFTTVCGDDPSAASETLAAFGEQVVGTARGIGIRQQDQ